MALRGLPAGGFLAKTHYFRSGNPIIPHKNQIQTHPALEPLLKQRLRASTSGHSARDVWGEGGRRSFRRRFSEFVSSLRHRDMAVNTLAVSGNSGGISTEKTIVDRLNILVEKGVGSLLLMLAATTSLFLANYPQTAGWWVNIWDTQIGPQMGEHALSLKGWINEALMSIFFFVVGLEIKKEIVVGSLSSMRTALLPCIAAVGGMLTPVLLYLLANLFPGGNLQGWSIPMATDIAFAMGIFSVFKSRMPPSVSPFLLTLATVDDLGAIAVIALAFSTGLHLPFFLLAAGITAYLAAMSKMINTNVSQYAVLGVGLWYALLRAGINADIAGVITAMAIPATRGFVAQKNATPKKRMDYAVVADGNLLEKLIHNLNPLSSLLIMPLFALANTAVPLGGCGGMDTCNSNMPLTMIGVALGLLVGKPLGIIGLTSAAVRAKLGSLPLGMTPKHLNVVGALGAIGFTMSIFLADAALTGLASQQAKLGIFISSVVAALVGSVYMTKFPKFDPKDMVPQQLYGSGNPKPKPAT